MTVNSPLIGPPPAEVPLAHPPLVRVIAQVRFPRVLSVEKPDFVAPFQEAIRADYPVLRREESRSVVLGPQGPLETRSNTHWRFHDVDDAWQVTLGTEFLALEARAYTNRAEFVRRLEVVLHALEAHVNPQVIDRLGVRYIDRVEGEDLDRLPQLVRPEVLGVLSTPLAEHLGHAVTESLFALPDENAQVTVRWGRIPARGAVDPNALEAIDTPSWILDIDAYQVGQQRLDVPGLVVLARRLSERIYSLFRWAITDAFLQHYGGEP